MNIRRALRHTMTVMGYLEQAGCRITGAHLLPCPAVRVDRAPSGLTTYAYREPPRGTIRVPVQHVALVRGVRVTWEAKP